MGVYVSAYLVYGFSLAHTDVEDSELAVCLPDHPGVFSLDAGTDGQRELFLAACVRKAGTGRPLPVDPVSDRHHSSAWNMRLAAAARDLGVVDQDPPGWLLIADVG